MTDEAPAKRGDAAWKEQREAISRRNAAVQKRALNEKHVHDRIAATAKREGSEREAAQLRELNARIAKQKRRG